MPAPVSWQGTPTDPKIWTSFSGGVGAPHVPIPLSGGGAKRSRRSKSRRHRKSKKSMRRGHTRRRR